MRNGIGLGGVIYLIIGIVVASIHGYLVGWDVLGNIAEGLLAIILWPLVFFNLVDLHLLFP